MNRLVSIGFAVAIGFAGSSQAQVNLSAETASPGGAPHLSMTHLGEVLSAAGVADLQIQAGQTLTNTVLNIAEGKTDVGVAPLVLPFLLNRGLGPYGKTGAEKGAELAGKLRALWPYSFGAYTLFAFETSGITGWDQLEGKTIYNGPPRGGALTGARQMLQIVAGLKEGEGYDGVQVNWPQATKTILDGTADVNLLPGTFPSDRVIAALSAGHVNIISVPSEIYESEAFQKWAKSPGNAPLIMDGSDLGYTEGVTVYSEDDKYRAVNITGAEIVSVDMDFELAKAITATYIATMDDLRAKAPFAPNIGVGNLDAVASGFCGPNPLKYHAGAVAAWEEAGFTVPDCAKES